MIETAIVILMGLLSIAAAYATKRMERARCLLIVASEPELPGEMPDEVWALSQKVNLETSLRIAVSGTKANIMRRIDAGHFPKSDQGGAK